MITEKSIINPPKGITSISASAIRNDGQYPVTLWIGGVNTESKGETLEVDAVINYGEAIAIDIGFRGLDGESVLYKET